MRKCALEASLDDEIPRLRMKKWPRTRSFSFQHQSPAYMRLYYGDVRFILGKKKITRRICPT